MVKIDSSVTRTETSLSGLDDFRHAEEVVRQLVPFFEAKIVPPYVLRKKAKAWPSVACFNGVYPLVLASPALLRYSFFSQLEVLTHEALHMVYVNHYKYFNAKRYRCYHGHDMLSHWVAEYLLTRKRPLSGEARDVTIKTIWRVKGEVLKIVADAVSNPDKYRRLLGKCSGAFLKMCDEYWERRWKICHSFGTKQEDRR